MSDDAAEETPLCPDLETWCAYVDGSLSDAGARAPLRAHLEGCDRCAGRVAVLRRDLSALDDGLDDGLGDVQTPEELQRRALSVGRDTAARDRFPWWRYAAAAVVALMAGGSWWISRAPGPVPRAGEFAMVERVAPTGAMGFAGGGSRLKASGTMRALVAFTRFQDATELAVPEEAATLFEADVPGSIAHYYEQMSFGRLRIGGDVLPRRLGARYGSPAYAAAPGEAWGRYDQYVLEILRQIDADVDLARFDDDGPDGVPNSGDDDGVVDYLVLVLPEAPEGFISGSANALIGLGLERPYATADLGWDGDPVIVSGAAGHGALVPEGSAAELTHAICHLMGHSLGLSHPDFTTAGTAAPSDLMGPGPGDGSGPAVMGAGHREGLGWLDADDERIRVVNDSARDLRLTDLQGGGRAVRIPLNGPHGDADGREGRDAGDYLLVEARQADGSAYGRESGLFIWRVRLNADAASGADGRTIELLCGPPGSCYGAVSAVTNIRQMGSAMLIDVESPDQGGGSE